MKNIVLYMDIEEVNPFFTIFDPSQILIQNRIGRGCQGSVYNACNQQNNQKYAIKVLNTSCMTEKEKERLRSQISSNFTLTSKQHFIYFPYFYGYWTTQNQAYLVFEKCQGNALQGISAHRTPASSYCFAYILLYDILNALSLLESRNIIHRDLKPQNILIDKGYFKVCDLGLSRIFEKGKKLTIDVGNIMSKSPQFYTGNYDCKTDIWSLAINAFWIAFGNLPFDEDVKQLIKQNKVAEVINKISKKQFNVNFGKMETYLISIFKDMLEIDKQKRLSASQILNKHFQNVNFNRHDVNQQIKYLFFNYLALRIKNEYQSKIILIVLFLVIDFTKMDEYLKKITQSTIQQEKIEHNRKELIMRVKFNIFQILIIIFEDQKDDISHKTTEICQFYLTEWSFQFQKDQKSRKNIENRVHSLQKCLQMYKLKLIQQKFPLVKQAVRIFKSLNRESSENWDAQNQIILWKISSFDLRKHKI